MKTGMNAGQRRDRGATLLLALIAVLVLSGLAGSMVMFSGAVQHESEATSQSTRALYVAEAGLSRGIASVKAGAPASDGAPDAPVDFAGGGYWYTVVPSDDGLTTTVTSYARVGTEARATEAILVKDGEGAFTSALFAGNSSGDPLYDMKFGGKGVQADSITGNVYSGGNIVITGDAKLNGTVRAGGNISGLPSGGETGASLPIPDIAGMDYANHNDYDVKSLFAGATKKSNSGLGGTAWQVPESNPAHIFRKNPSDRTANTSTTVKDDYFLEDPYESVNTSSTVDPAHATHITLSGQDNNPGSNGSHKVYYIDGNLWIHNLNIYSFVLYNSGADQVEVTFVVKGNIYISDNILYQGVRPDGLAMIAVKDSGVTDSGNIYFGDPTFGTLERMDSFMYAENNFIDSNLSATGSARVTVNGNMTAGNEVKINRDYGTQHSKLTVNYDDRLQTGTVTLPGLPSQVGGPTAWSVVSWREVPMD
jgi:hypothetical protein